MRTTSVLKGAFIFGLVAIGLVCGRPHASAQTLNQKGRAFTSALEKVARSETAGKQLHGLAQRGDREGIAKLLIQNGAPRDTIVTAVTPPQGTIPEEGKGTLGGIAKGLNGANITVSFGGGKGTTVTVSGQPKGGAGTECTGSLSVGSNGQATVSAGCGSGSSSGSSKK